jgi:topoisomerase-4 subunit B
MQKLINDNNEGHTWIEDDILKIRNRPDLHLGEVTENGALYRMLTEVIDNVKDLYIEGKANVVNIYVAQGQHGLEFIIYDNGPGFPVKNYTRDSGEVLDKTIFEIALTKLSSGSKFEGSQGTTAGTHGEGISCTNAMSYCFSCWTFRDDNWYNLEFNYGQKIGNLQYKEPLIPGTTHGTFVQFIPDYYNFFMNMVFNKNRLLSDLNDYSMLLPGLTFNLNWCGESHQFFSTNFNDFISSTIKKDNMVDPKKVFEYYSPKLDLIVTWVDSYDPVIKSFVNASPTPEGGDHVLKVEKVVVTVIKEYSSKKKTDIGVAEVRQGLVVILNARITAPRFTSQTKEKLSGTVKVEYYDELKTAFSEWCVKHKTFVKEVVKKAESIQKLESKWAKEKLAEKDAKSSPVKGREKLEDNLYRTRDKCDPLKKELFIIEGESAGGTASSARDSSYQEVLLLQGKPMNALRKHKYQVFNDKVLNNICLAIFNEDLAILKPHDLGEKLIDRMVVGKIILLPDADEDGRHIEALVTSFIMSYLEPIINAERLFIVRAPLFEVVYKDSVYYGHNHNDLIEATGDPNVIKYHPMRMKGWGSCGPEQLSKFAFNNKTRSLIKINKPDEYQILNVKKLMSEDSSARKALTS